MGLCSTDQKENEESLQKNEDILIISVMKTTEKYHLESGL